MNGMRICALAALVISGAASAQGLGLSANVSSLGLGLDLSRSFSPAFTGRLGINGYNYNRSLSESGIDYDAKFKWQSAHLLADWYPAQGVFRTSVGLVYNDNKFSMTGKASGGTYTIADHQYTADQIGALGGEVTFRKSAPYLGVGWGNPVGAGKSWGFVADLGVLYQGAPRATLTVTCGAAVNCSALQGDVQAQQDKLGSDLNSFKWYPVFSIGASYQF